MALPVLVAASCTSGGPEGSSHAVDGSTWVAEVALTPSAFEALTAANRDGWAALHRSDLGGAVEAFDVDSTGAIRSRIARQTVYADLVAITDLAVWRTLVEWDRRALPTDDGIDGIVPLWRRCGGPTRVPEAMGEGAVIPFDKSSVPEWATERVDAYAADPDALRALVATPVWTRGARVVRDPCGYAFLLASDDTAQLTAALTARTGLASRFLSATPTHEDLLAEASRAPSAGQLGARSPSLPPPTAVDLSSLHADVAALDDALEDLEQRITRAASADGVALMAELGLMQRLRQEVLVARARELMEVDPAIALAAADIAWDATDRAVGPQNIAGAASVRARALLAAGRTRETLDALEPLMAALPEAAGAREWVADLAVIEGLDRSSDSKEE